MLRTIDSIALSKVCESAAVLYCTGMFSGCVQLYAQTLPFMQDDQGK